MKLLVHLGLNKCASTYIQYALDESHGKLAAVGTCYPWQQGPPAHYGLSRYYGFGPTAEEVEPVSLADLISEARLAGCDRIILSSEYLSLHAPRAVSRLAEDLARHGTEVVLVMIRRPLEEWVISLFNQYVKTVDGGRHLPNVDAFAEQVLRNRAIDIRRRVEQWRVMTDVASLTLYELAPGAASHDVLAPFEAFAGTPLPPPIGNRANESLDADRLFAIGLLRQRPVSQSRDRAIGKLLAGQTTRQKAPADYIVLGDDMRARLFAEIGEPAAELGWTPLPSRNSTPLAA